MPLENTTVNNNLSKEDMVDLLSEEEKVDDKDKHLSDSDKEKDKKKPADDDKTGDEEEQEEEEQEEEEEIELETEPEDEKLELIVPVNRKEILKKYPTIFKEFPYLEKAYYREQQYTEIFPTLSDAKEAVEKAQTLDKFEEDVSNGDLTKILSAVKQNDSNAFNKVADTFLTQLGQVDQNAVHHIIGNVIKNTIMHMAREAKNLGEENGAALNQAAQLLNQFVFGTSQFSPPTNLSKQTNEDDTEKRKIQEERQQLVKERFETVRDDLSGRVQNALKSTINNHIDPKQSMTEYVRKNATREAYESLESLIAKDTRFTAIMDRLWGQAFDSNFSRQSIENIRSAYLSKAKTLLPSVIQKARNEALKGITRRNSQEEEQVDRKGPLPVGRHTTSNTNANPKTPKEIPKGMKSVDFLLQD